MTNNIRTMNAPSDAAIARNVRVTLGDDEWHAYHDGYGFHAVGRYRNEAIAKVVARVRVEFARAVAHLSD